jgi:lysophospholipase L1-like esterase
MAVEETARWRRVGPVRSAAALSMVVALLAGCASASGRPVQPPPSRESVVETAVPPEGSSYVALGSSFAAGPRIPPNQGGRCLRSNNNYAHLVARALDLQLKDVSCSGALASGLSAPNKIEPSAQLSAVTGATRLVTLTAGGNDIGYAADLENCTVEALAGRSCLTMPTWLAQSRGELPALRNTLIAVLGWIRATAPRAQVYVLSYLPVLPPDGRPCAPNVPLGSAEAQTLTQLGLQLRDTIRSAALASQVHFVDAYTAGLAHSACAPPSSRWVEGTQRVLPALEYHPNARGMVAVASLLLTAIRHGT